MFKRALKVVKIISQHVDTLKNHYYLSNDLSDDSYSSYIKILDSLISLKKEAQQLKNDFKSEKSISYFFGEHKFHVMAQSVSGFSVVIKNNDCSIALRKSKTKLASTPVIKVEFRSEFLARRGYIKALKIINKFISDYLLDTYTIKVSEIHLATDIQGYNFTPLDFYRLKTRSRISATHEEITPESKSVLYGRGTTFSGFYFGGGDYRLRIYNKTLEINKFKDKGFAKTYLWTQCPDYSDGSNVWRIELQIRRNKFKKLTNSSNDTLDDYENLLNAIPSIWLKAINDFQLRNISDIDTFNILRGKRTLKNGSEKLLTKNAIYQIFKRSSNIDFWFDIQTWNSFKGSHIDNAFKLPQTSFQYVSNSIKSLFSTMSRHYGSISQKTLMQAFIDSNDESLSTKQISLIEDSINKQLEYFDKIDYLVSNGVRSVPDYSDLQDSIYSFVFSASDSLYNSDISTDLRQKLLSRSSSRNKNLIDYYSNSNIRNCIESCEVF